MTASALVIAPLALAFVLTVAAVAKITAHLGKTGPEAPLHGRGIPAVINAPWARRVHPWAELALAVALLATPWPVSVVAAALALILCVGYLWLVAAVLASREPQDCACFGRLSSGPVGRWDLARNFSLVLLATVTLAWAIAGRSVGADLVALTGGDWLWLAVVALAALAPAAIRWVRSRMEPARPAASPAAATSAPMSDEPTAVAGGVRQNLTERPAPSSLEEAQPEDLTGLALPKVMITDTEGKLAPLRRHCLGAATLLILVRPSCRACDEVLSQLDVWQERFGDRVSVRLLVSKQPEKFAEQHPELANLTFVDVSQAIAPLLGVRYTPSALLIAPDASIAAGPTTGAEYIASLADVIIDSLGSPTS